MHVNTDANTEDTHMTRNAWSQDASSLARDIRGARDRIARRMEDAYERCDYAEWGRFNNAYNTLHAFWDRTMGFNG